MELSKRVKLGLNAYVKNDAFASAVASTILNKDCAVEELINIEQGDAHLPGVLPLLRSVGIETSDTKYQSVLKTLCHMCNYRLLFLVCGGSCAGKDALISAANSRLYNDRQEVTFLEKYTTRPPRGYENSIADKITADPSSQYKYYDDLKALKSSEPDAELIYDLYGNYYGFSGNHLNSDAKKDNNLLCIYGRLEEIHEAKRKVLEEFKRIPIAILINAPEEDMIRRLENRAALSPEDKIARTKEVKRQVRFIKNNPELIKSGFDIVINNPDEAGFSEGSDQMFEFLRETVQMTVKK